MISLIEGLPFPSRHEAIPVSCTEYDDKFNYFLTSLLSESSFLSSEQALETIPAVLLSFQLFSDNLHLRNPTLQILRRHTKPSEHDGPTRLSHHSVVVCLLLLNPCSRRSAAASSNDKLQAILGSSI